MNSKGRITILLTLKGRPLFTLRWLWHANRTKLPFHVFVADGEVDLAIAGLMGNHAALPNLDIEYHRYADLSFLHYYRKVDDALSRIHTPYVMLADNDDFLFPAGIVKSMEFLDARPDYVCVGGGVAHFETALRDGEIPNLYGVVRRYWYQQRAAYRAYNLDSERASDRLYKTYRNALTVFYNVYRVDALRVIAREMLARNFQLLENAEVFWNLRTATLGKVKSDPSYVSYLRQIGTSLNPTRKKDFIDTLCHRCFISEMRDIEEAMAQAAALTDNLSEEMIASRLLEISTERLRARLTQNYGCRTAFKSSFRRILPPSLMRMAVNATEWARSGRSSAAGGKPVSHEQVLEMVEKAGAARTDLDMLAADMTEVERTLVSDDMRAFVQEHSSRLGQPA